MNTRSIREYQVIVEDLDAVRKTLAQKREEFEDSISDLKTKKAELEDLEKELKQSLSEEALEEYQETGNKKFPGGIAIREEKSVDYEEDKAFEFAKEKGMFLKLDRKAFEKAADSLGLSFVEISKKPKVTFPKVIKLAEEE